ncbi:HAMP domain-containing sensor histidine kinase [uncultured Rhodoferax sp.]|uniref:sensor histidine kinase n=1 Tax=uncultured Rhodoferax sp. TaxID=223188 RepID=UPI0025D26460|nr:HAMP domain-containing sensor histidine kinase [uncultured Rhodoferax sp.]
MPTKSERTPLAQYERRAFAHYFVFDLHFPLAAVAFLTAVCAWLMHEHGSIILIAAWVGFAVVANSVREMYMWRSRAHMEDPRRQASVLQVYTWSSLASGLTWGAFGSMYIDTHQPLAQLLAGSIFAGLIGVAVTPLAVHLPAFYAFVLPILAPYVWIMVQAGGTEQLILAGMTVVFLGVISRYAHDSHRMHRETVRLRFENQQLIADLEDRRVAAEEASQTKSLFLAGVSHDLKQPIRAMGLYLGVLQHTESAAQASALVSVVPKMEKALGELHGQVSRLLELSRLESGALQLHMEHVSMQSIFADLQALFGEQARSKGIRLHCADTRQRRHASVLTDRQLLDSILQNLVSNALKHTTSGAVYVGARWRLDYPAGHQLCIEVRDSGTGIASHLQPRLFEAYRSFDDRQASESHGLGLAIAKAQASYLGCDIRLRSVEGRGSTFTLCGLALAPL